MEYVVLTLGCLAIAYVVYRVWQKKKDDVEDFVEDMKDKLDK